MLLFVSKESRTACQLKLLTVRVVVAVASYGVCVALQDGVTSESLQAQFEHYGRVRCPNLFTFDNLTKAQATSFFLEAR